MITLEEIKKYIEYNSITGHIKFIHPKGRQPKEWFPGYLGSHGYYMIQIKKTSYLIHRLAFLFMTGHLPVYIVDHIDQNKRNNIWSNLRDTSRTNNNLNKSKPLKNNKSGYLGVAKHPKGWTAQLKINGKRII